jgi:hypothetical protein
VSIAGGTAPRSTSATAIVCHDVRNPAQRNEVFVVLNGALGPEPPLPKRVM